MRHRKNCKIGHLECLKYVHHSSNNSVLPKNYITALVARHGHLDCLRYLVGIGYDFDGLAIRWAAGLGQLECLKYCVDVLFEKDLSKREIGLFIYSSMVDAAANEHLDCLKYCTETSFSVQLQECEETVSNKHLCPHFTTLFKMAVRWTRKKRYNTSCFNFLKRFASSNNIPF